MTKLTHACVLMALMLVAATSGASRGYVLHAGPSACPFGPEFESAIDSRLSAAIEPPPPDVHVSVEREGERFRARMRLERRDNKPTTRELHVDDCEVAVSVLATVVAIALEALVTPEARRKVQPTPVPAPQKEAPAREPPREVPWRPGIGLEGVLDFSLTPQFAHGGNLFGTLTRGERWPGIRLHAGYRANPAASASGREFEASLFGGGVQICPVLARPTAGLEVEPCAALELGRYRAKGTRGFSRGVEQTELWSSAQAIGRGRVAIIVGLSWELAAHLVFPFQSRMSLVADVPGETRQIQLFDAPFASFALSTGVKLDIP